MADSEKFHHPEGDHLLAGEATSFSELLFSNDDGDGDVVGLDHRGDLHYSSAGKPPKMLCFGGYDDQNEGNVVLFSDATKITPQKSGVTCSDSSSASSGNNNNQSNNKNIVSANTVSKPNRKRNVPKREPVVRCANTIEQTPLALASERTSKKTKAENPTSTGRAKVGKEKLGDRITALQQLVSPFGKTDTASVLHEAMGYIRFLQDQVQVLCSPYLQDLPEGGVNGGEGPRKDLRSRGLCLVPVDCTVHVISSNGADYWSPAAMANDFSSSGQQ